MPENALDRLSKIQNNQSESPISLDDEFNESISSTEFLDGMSDLAKQNLSSIFEEVTMEDENDLVMPLPASPTIEESQPKPNIQANNEVNNSFNSDFSSVSTKNIQNIEENESNIEENTQEISYRQPRMTDLVDETEDEIDKLASSLAQNDTSDDFIASDPPKFSRISSENTIDTEDSDDFIDKKDVRELKRQLKDKDKENQQLKKSQKLMTTEIQTLTKENEKLTNKVNKLTEENTDLKSKLSRRQLKVQNGSDAHESPFKYNTVSTVADSSKNPIYDQLVNNIIKDLISKGYKLETYNEDAMQLLFSYMQSKF